MIYFSYTNIVNNYENSKSKDLMTGLSYKFVGKVGFEPTRAAIVVTTRYVLFYS